MMISCTGMLEPCDNFHEPGFYGDAIPTSCIFEIILNHPSFYIYIDVNSMEQYIVNGGDTSRVIIESYDF